MFDICPHWWQVITTQPLCDTTNGTFGPYSNPYVAKILPFGSARIQKSQILSSHLSVAAGLLRGFMEGRLPASEVFDVELFSRFMATAEIWSAEHMLVWHNLRFYLRLLEQARDAIREDRFRSFREAWRDRLGPGA